MYASRRFMGYLNVSYEELGYGWEDGGVSKVRFLWNADGLSLAKRIREDLNATSPSDERRKKPLTKRDVLVLETGHWDLMERNVSYFVNTSLSTILDAIGGLRSVVHF